MNEQDIYQEAIKHWGIEPQLNVAIEECSELTKELCKYMRHHSLTQAVKNAIADEVADVQIMCEQVKIIFGIEQEVGVARMAKLQRIKERLESGQHKAY
jgi:NTP pyrophosphatase (non-canonical NTP hydrolase)